MARRIRIPKIRVNDYMLNMYLNRVGKLDQAEPKEEEPEE